MEPNIALAKYDQGEIEDFPATLNFSVPVSIHLLSLLSPILVHWIFSVSPLVPLRLICILKDNCLLPIILIIKVPIILIIKVPRSSLHLVPCFLYPPQPTRVTLTMIGSAGPGFPRYGWEGRDMHPHPTLNPRMRLIKYPINVSRGVSAYV